jgi:trans-aconitate 2-methyltransferase
MPPWNPGQYLKFDEERTRPCRDLVQRIGLKNPRRIIDLGCGPGNSTGVLAEHWPEAAITGLDHSEEMIRAAREKYPHGKWERGGIAAWNPGETFDLIFSNAALQWVPDHAAVLPRLFGHVAPGGALAWQVPANIDAPAHQLMRDIASVSRWRARFPEKVREWFVHEPAFYYDLLAATAERLDLWSTDYLHVVDGPSAIVEWYRGTGLRPFLDLLAGPAEKEEFLSNYLREIAKAYPRQSDGRVLFLFRRFFAIAYRK